MSDVDLTRFALLFFQTFVFSSYIMRANKSSESTIKLLYLLKNISIN